MKNKIIFGIGLSLIYIIGAISMIFLWTELRGLLPAVLSKPFVIIIMILSIFCCGGIFSFLMIKFIDRSGYYKLFKEVK